MQITEASHVTPELVSAFDRLIPQLSSSNPPPTEDELRSIVESEASKLLLAVDDDGRIVGSVIAGFDGWRAHVYRMAVLPEARGRGVGRALVDAMEARFRRLGAVRSDAIVLLDNELGRSFWKAVGYEPDPASDRWVRWL